MRLKDFGTTSGLGRLMADLVSDSVRRPWRIIINVIAISILGLVWLAAVLARLS